MSPASIRVSFSQKSPFVSRRRPDKGLNTSDRYCTRIAKASLKLVSPTDPDPSRRALNYRKRHKNIPGSSDAFLFTSFGANCAAVISCLRHKTGDSGSPRTLSNEKTLLRAYCLKIKVSRARTRQAVCRGSLIRNVPPRDIAGQGSNTA